MYAVYPKSPYGQSPNPLTVNPNSAVTQIQIPSLQGDLGIMDRRRSLKTLVLSLI